MWVPTPRAAGPQAVAPEVTQASQSKQATPAGRQGQSGARGDSQNRQSNQRPRLPWWKDPEVIKAISLTPDQAAQIERLWQERAKEMAGRRDEQLKQQAELNRLLDERKVSADVIALQVDRVEAQRTLLEKSWTVMIYRMSQVLSADQNKALQMWRNRRNESHRQ